jgi:cysteine sulfinate desulfinase/cysteine desulfurase-like protein
MCGSGRSAYLAGAASHVLAALGRQDGVLLRFSFSKFNTIEEVNEVISLLEGLVKVKAAVAG